MAAIILNNPGVVAPTTEAVYPILWLSDFHIYAQNPNNPVNISAQIDKMRVVDVDKDGNPKSYELMSGGSTRVEINDFFNVATLGQLEVAHSLLKLMQDITDPPAK